MYHCASAATLLASASEHKSSALVSSALLSSQHMLDPMMTKLLRQGNPMSFELHPDDPRDYCCPDEKGLLRRSVIWINLNSPKWSYPKFLQRSCLLGLRPQSFNKRIVYPRGLSALSFAKLGSWSENDEVRRNYSFTNSFAD